MDVDVFNGTIEQLKAKWPFDSSVPWPRRIRKTLDSFARLRAYSARRAFL